MDRSNFVRRSASQSGPRSERVVFQRDAHGAQLGLSLGHVLDRLVERGAAALEVPNGVRLIENRLVLDGGRSRLFETPDPLDCGVRLFAGIIRPCVQSVEPVDAVGGEVRDVRQIFQPSLGADEIVPAVPRAFEVLVMAKLRLHAEATLAQGVDVALYAFEPGGLPAVLGGVVHDLPETGLDLIEPSRGGVNGVLAPPAEEQVPLLIVEHLQRVGQSGRAYSRAVYLAVYAIVTQQSIVVQLVERESEERLERIPGVAAEQTGKLGTGDGVAGLSGEGDLAVRPCRRRAGR